jgi:integrase
MVFIPRKLSPTGKRQAKYFPSKNQALKFVQEFKEETREHGRSGVSAQDREWIAFARNKLGNLSLLPEVIRHWERTGAHLEPMATEAAVNTYFDAILPNYKRVTRYDVTSRLGKFASHFGKKPLHEIRPADVEDFLGTISAGGNRWSSFKRLRPFFKFAKRRNWVSVNVTEEIPAPKVEPPSREVYSVSDFHSLLWMAEGHYPDLLPFIVLAGYCFLRTAELVKTFREDKVLRWQNILWDENPPVIHVPNEIAKSTRSASDERFIPLISAAVRWLSPIRKDQGEVMPMSSSRFWDLWAELTDLGGVPRIPNGLRHSCISYSLAANPEHGVALTSQWAGNSEVTIRKHYRRLLRQADGKMWFGLESAVEWEPKDQSP